MPLQLRSTTLTAAVCDRGIRVYTKTKDGDVREGCNDTTEWALNQARRDGNRRIIDHGEGWFPGELRFKCSPDSALCAIAWAGQGPGWSQSVFYQTQDGCLRERRHLNHWQETSFVQPDCMLGTNIAAVSSSYGASIYLFYQDSNGYICTCHAKNLNWSSPIRICKAAKCTGIGATSWADCDVVRVYFQDESNAICEYSGGNKHGSIWSGCDFRHPCNFPVGDISAVSWLTTSGVEIRLYFQDEQCNIIDWCSDPKGHWQQGQFRYAALPNSDIIAYMRTPGYAPHISVMWAGQDQVLWQKVNSEGFGWMTETPIAFLQATGRFYGSWTGTSFSDNSLSADSKVIRQLRIRSEARIDGLALDFTDGTSTSWHGGQGGSYSTFGLNSNEDFTHIRVAADENWILGLQFITSKGRESPWYGSKSGSVSIWELDGRALGGFMGSTTQYVSGLMPFWSERYSPANLTNLQSCITEGEHIRKEIELAAMRCSQLRSQTEELQKDIEIGLRAPADHAIQGVGVLCGSIEELYNQTQKAVVAQNAEVDRLVKLCKGQAVIVASRFNALYDESTKMMDRGGELNVELTAQLGESQTRMTRIDNLQSVADGLKKGAEVRAETMKENKETAEWHQREAEKTKREAESKLSSAKTARVIRDIFTLGLGRVGDWFNLDEAVRYANKLIESCQRNLQQAQDDMQAADSALKNIKSELNRFTQLHSSINSYKGQLQETMRLAITLREKNMQLQNTSLDISLFLGGFVARTETIETKLTAAQFAKAILAVEQLLVTPTKVSGLIRNDAQKLEGTMEMIAKSDALADTIGDIM